MGHVAQMNKSQIFWRAILHKLLRLSPYKSAYIPKNHEHFNATLKMQTINPY